MKAGLPLYPDGQYIVTCAGGDSPSGTLRAYFRSAMAFKFADGNLYDGCKLQAPMEILGHRSFRHAALGTDDGYALSQAVKPTFREEMLMKT